LIFAWLRDKRHPTLAALTTEHFVMQGAIGTSVNEQEARASMYLYSVSGALVAIGFMAQSDCSAIRTRSSRTSGCTARSASGRADRGFRYREDETIPRVKGNRS